MDHAVFKRIGAVLRSYMNHIDSCLLTEMYLYVYLGSASLKKQHTIWSILESESKLFVRSWLFTRTCTLKYLLILVRGTIEHELFLMSSQTGIRKWKVNKKLICFISSPKVHDGILQVWASSWENLSLEFSTKLVSNWPAQLQKLARVLKFRIYLSSEHSRRWSDCADSQADLRLYCSHIA